MQFLCSDWRWCDQNLQPGAGWRAYLQLVQRNLAAAAAVSEWSLEWRRICKRVPMTDLYLAVPGFHEGHRLSCFVLVYNALYWTSSWSGTVDIRCGSDAEELLSQNETKIRLATPCTSIQMVVIRCVDYVQLPERTTRGTARLWCDEKALGLLSNTSLVCFRT